MKLPDVLRCVLVGIMLAATAVAKSPLAEQSLAELVEALESVNPAIRAEAADEIGRRRDPRGLVPLIRLLNDPATVVRARAAEALRAMGDERAVPFLSRALEDPEPVVRCRAVLALGDVGGKYVLPALKLRLADPALVVRAATVRAMGEIGDPLSLDDVVSAYRREKEDKDDAMASAALIAAAKLGGKAGLDQVFATAAKRLAESWFLRACAAHASGLAKDKTRIPMLAGYLSKDEDPRVSQAAATGLAMLGAEDELLAAAEHPDFHRRRAAITGLDHLGGEKAVAAIVKATRDDNPGVVLEAAAALVSRGEVQAIPLLINLLDRETPLWMGALQVLELRTGMLIGRNPPAWREWFDAREEFLRWDAGEGAFKGVK